LTRKNDLPGFLTPYCDAVEGDNNVVVNVGESFKTIEKKVMEANLKYYNDKKKVANVLGISSKTLGYKIKNYNIKF